MDEVDLHGTRHEEVARKLENFLYQHIQKGTSEVKVITGKSPEMKKIVFDIVEQYKMSATEEWNNFGCLIINMK
jgi:DNA-nicking Smr family endonuclease